MRANLIETIIGRGKILKDDIFMRRVTTAVKSKKVELIFGNTVDRLKCFVD